MTDEPESLDDDLENGLAEHLDELTDQHERERRALARCPHCGSPNIRRSHNEGIGDKILRLFGRRAYRCRDCRDRFHAARSLLRS
jgi:uncharacterized protein with PIN domain